MAYFEGGPGDSSEYGLFTQHGPCHFIDNQSEPSLNPYSFNNRVNMLYIDQPVGVGFSYGNTTINSTKAAAPHVWNALQMFFTSFPEYEERNFGILTYSYGGHYGPEFSRYILAQNAAIKNGIARGTHINLTALLATNSWFDASIQEKSDIEFAYNNTYRQLINGSFHDELLSRYNNDVKPACDLCAATGTISDCSDAFEKYSDEIDDPLEAAITTRFPAFNQEDVRAASKEAPLTHEDFLSREDVKKAIGARVDYLGQSEATLKAFQATGDGRHSLSSTRASMFVLTGRRDARSFLGELSEIVRAGVKVLIWTGDTDSVCDWQGTLEVANTVEWDHRNEFASRSLEPYTVNGTEKGTSKHVENLTFMRVFEAGHDLAFYRQCNPALGLRR